MQGREATDMYNLLSHIVLRPIRMELRTFFVKIMVEITHLHSLPNDVECMEMARKISKVV